MRLCASTELPVVESAELEFTIILQFGLLGLRNDDMKGDTELDVGLFIESDREEYIALKKLVSFLLITSVYSAESIRLRLSVFIVIPSEFRCSQSTCRLKALR